MYGNLALQLNTDGTYDLVIHYSRSGDTEFSRDFLSADRITQSYRSVSGYLRKYAKGLRLRSAKVMVGTMVVAVVPLSLILSASAAVDKYSIAYLHFGDQQQQLEQVAASQDVIDTISPNYITLQPDGSLEFHPPAPGLVQSYHSMGLRVIPYLSNQWDRQSGINALEHLDTMADSIAAFVAEHDLDGISVALENLTPGQREKYVSFIEQLRQKLPEDKEISVAVAANPNSGTGGWQGTYDYAALAQHADYLMLMAYDEHYQGSAPGPVASIDFVEDSVHYALTKTTPDNIVLGLPFYGRIWGGDGSMNGNRVPLMQVEELLSQYNAQITFDQTSGSPKATFLVTDDDPKQEIQGKPLRPGSYELWFENDQSILQKLELVNTHNLKGIGTWALGQQSASVWEAYSSWIDGYEYTLEKIPKSI